MLTNIIVLSAIISLAGCMTIQNHWEHVKFKLLALARVDVRDTGEVVLTCSATGSPVPVVAWYKDGLFAYHEVDEDLVEAGSSSLGETVARLRLPCISAKDAGKYECRAIAGKQQVSAVTEVNVVDWDANLCSERDATVSGKYGRHGHVDGQHGRGCSNDDMIHVSATGDLVITRVTWSDMGQYTCTVTNTAGRDAIQTFLYPLASSPSGGQVR